MLMGGESHTHRQVTSTMLSIESQLLHRLTPARSLSRGLGRARSYNKVCHVTESRAIASRCPKLRTSKGHLVYKRPPARSQLRSRKPILRHARYNIHAAHMSSMNSRYHHITLQSTSLFTYIYRVYKDHMSMITLHHTTEAN